MELLELLQKRRSIRKYTGEHIPEDKLERILQAGLPAPSSRAYSERTEKHSRSFSVSCCASDFCLRFSRTACVGGLYALMPKSAASSSAASRQFTPYLTVSNTFNTHSSKIRFERRLFFPLSVLCWIS